MEDSAAERSNRGQDLAYDLEITLEEAAKGAEKEIEIPELKDVMFAVVQARPQALRLEFAQDAAAQVKFKTCVKAASACTCKLLLAHNAKEKAN